MKDNHSQHTYIRSDLYKSNMFYNFCSEYEVLGSISHHLIQVLFDSSVDFQNISNIVESESSSLLSYYQGCYPLPQYIAIPIFARLLEAIEYLHSNMIAHLDIRVENVFIVDGFFRLGGFTNAEYVYDDVSITKEYGAKEYQAPEIGNHRAYNAMKADSWACGVFLHFLLEGKLPSPVFPNDIICDDPIHLVLIKLLSPDPNLRPFLKEIKSNNLFSSINTNEPLVQLTAIKSVSIRRRAPITKILSSSTSVPKREFWTIVDLFFNKSEDSIQSIDEFSVKAYRRNPYKIGIMIKYNFEKAQRSSFTFEKIMGEKEDLLDRIFIEFVEKISSYE